MSNYSDTVYQSAFSIEYEWENYLPVFIYKFHYLMYREFNTPMSLQMGTLLPFISSLCGPKTRGEWTTRKSVINFFTINVASSGCGKTVCRSHFITEPLQYIMQNDSSFPDMEVNKFTRAGIEDKIKSTNGYCIVTTDEGTGLFKDLKNKESKHESDLSLLNQLYDGKGDKTTLAKEYQRVIPNNSTSICISLQQEGYLTGITGLGSTNWLDSGFSERFMILASRPFRHEEKDKRRASHVLQKTYGHDLMGKIALAIYTFHKDEAITYKLTPEAYEVYEGVVKKYNDQFNMKWTARNDDILLDSQERAEIKVRSKASELVGRLSVILWVYINAFECVHKGLPFNIPTLVSADCVANADRLIKTSYEHSETFNNAAFAESNKLTYSYTRHALTDRNRVLAGLIRMPGPVVNIRLLQKNFVRNMSVDVIKDELKSLENEGFGKLFTSEEQKMLASTQPLGFNPQNVFFKPSPMNLEPKFIERLRDKDICELYYGAQFDKPIEKGLVNCVARFHPHAGAIAISQPGSNSSGNYNPLSWEAPAGSVKGSLFGAKKTSKKNTSVRYHLSQPSGPSDTYKTSDLSSAQRTKGNTRRRALSPSEHVDIVTALLSSSEDDSRGSYSTTQSEKLKKVKAKCGRKEQSDVTQGNKSENHDSDELFSQPRLQEETGAIDTQKKEHTYVKKHVSKSLDGQKVKSSVKASKRVHSTQRKTAVTKGSTQLHGLTGKDFEDFLNDSSFDMDDIPLAKLSGKQSSKSKSTIVNQDISESIAANRPRRAATSKYQFRRMDKRSNEAVPKIFASDTESGKSDKEIHLKKSKACSNEVIPDSQSEKSGDKAEPANKRRRRLSLKQRNTQRSGNKLSTQSTKK